MTTFSDTWNTAFDQSPADTDDASEGALRIRKTRVATKERLAVDHSVDGDAHDGKHKKVSLRPQVADPTLDSGDGAVYIKTISGVAEIFYKDSSGTAIQLTSAGRINLSALPSSLADASTLNGQPGSYYQNASNIISGTLALDRLPATLTGKDADTLDGQHGSYYKDVVAGTPMLFYATIAPSGWVLNSGLNDRLIRVVSSSGGVVGGSWTISGLSVLGHPLTVDEMPPHTHNYTFTYVDVAGTNALQAGNNYNTFFEQRTSTVTGNGATHTHGISHNGAWRPAYADFILCNRSV